MDEIIFWGFAVLLIDIILLCEIVRCSSPVFTICGGVVSSIKVLHSERCRILEMCIKSHWVGLLIRKYSARKFMAEKRREILDEEEGEEI